MTQAATVSIALTFHPHTETPSRPGDGDNHPQAILYNPCDGYHIVFARFDVDDGEFQGFYDWCGTEPYEPGRFFEAWALLPNCNKVLWPAFGDPAKVDRDQKVQKELAQVLTGMRQSR